MGIGNCVEDIRRCGGSGHRLIYSDIGMCQARPGREASPAEALCTRRQRVDRLNRLCARPEGSPDEPRCPGRPHVGPR